MYVLSYEDGSLVEKIFTCDDLETFKNDVLNCVKLVEVSEHGYVYLFDDDEQVYIRLSEIDAVLDSIQTLDKWAKTKATKAVIYPIPTETCPRVSFGSDFDITDRDYRAYFYDRAVEGIENVFKETGTYPKNVKIKMDRYGRMVDHEFERKPNDEPYYVTYKLVNIDF
jgi:hypothetical protein